MNETTAIGNNRRPGSTSWKIRVGFGATLCALVGACDPGVAPIETDVDGTFRAKTTANALVVSSDVMTAIKEWELSDRDMTLAEHLEAKARFRTTTDASLTAAVSALSAPDTCTAFISEPDFSGVHRIDDQSNDNWRAWSEGVSFMADVNLDYDNVSDDDTVIDSFGAQNKVKFEIFTECPDETANIVPKLALHSSYFGRVSVRSSASTRFAGSAEATARLQGVTATRVTEFDSGDVLTVLAANSLQLQSSSKAQSQDWQQELLLEIVDIARDYAKITVDTSEEAVTAFGPKKVAKNGTADADTIIADAASAAKTFLNGIVQDQSQSNFHKTTDLFAEKELGRVLDDSGQPLAIGKTYIVTMHSEYSIETNAKTHHKAAGWPRHSRQHAHAGVQVIDDFLLAGVVGFEDSNHAYRVPGTEEAAFFVAGTKPSHPNLFIDLEEVPDPLDEPGPDDEDIHLTGLSSDRNFAELANDARSFFSAVWPTGGDLHDQVFARLELMADRDATNYKTSDIGKTDGVNVVAETLTGINTPCIRTE
ncbi:MAG: hypothetical protein AAF799_10695 [Myxococcota bacterium]